jgi:hypothetical protein
MDPVAGLRSLNVCEVFTHLRTFEDLPTYPHARPPFGACGLPWLGSGTATTSTVAAVRLSARQQELGWGNRFAPPNGKISGKKNGSFTSPAKYSEIPPFIDRAQMA